MSGRRVARVDGVEGTWSDAGNSEAPRSKTGSFRKTVVHVGDHEEQFLRVIVCCASRKLSGAFGALLPGPIKRRPPSGLYKETILMGFPGYFQRSHHSLQDQQKSSRGRRPVWCPPESFRSCRGLASAALEDHHFHRLGQGRCSVGNKAGATLRGMPRGILLRDAKARL